MNINAAIFGQVITFFLFVLFCMKYIWPPIISAIEKRQKEISEGIAFIEKAKKDLDLSQKSVIKQLKKAKKEASIIIEEANKRRIQILEEVKTEAEKERNKIIEQARIKIESEYNNAREELRKQIAILVMLGIEKIIERSLNLDDNIDIIDKLISEL